MGSFLEKYYGQKISEEALDDMGLYIEYLITGLEEGHEKFREICEKKRYKLVFLEIALVSAVAMFLEDKTYLPHHMLMQLFKKKFEEMWDDLTLEVAKNGK